MSDGEKVIRLMQTQEDCAALRRLLDAARAEEREACAMLCELLADSATTDHLDFAAADDFREAAAAIRGRK